MKNITTVTAPNEAVYLADFMTELPVGILMKNGTGVGGTHIAITSDKPYIIAVPLTELITNKKHKHSEIYGVSGVHKWSISSIKEYLLTNTSPKFMVTYDSLHRLIDTLKELGIDVYNDYRMLADEYHTILTEYSYRGKAMRSLLLEVTKFNYYTFLSATPIDEEFNIDLLNNIPITKVVWYSKQKIKVVRCKTNKPYVSVTNLIKQFILNGNKLTLKANGVDTETNELYFFINSTVNIKNIIDNAGLTQADVKIICSDTLKNRHTLESFEINAVNDPNKPITFITSKAFIGCDFESKNGVSFIVSSVSNKNTMLDISTAITQIVGRIRTKENPFKNKFFHIYNTRVADMTTEEWEAVITEKRQDTLLEMSTYNKLTKEEQVVMVKRIKEKDSDLFYTYYDEETKTLKFDDIKEQNERFMYKVTKELYNNGVTIRDGYLKAGITLDGDQNFDYYDEQFIKKATSLSFENLVTAYFEELSKDIMADKDYITELERTEPLLKRIVQAKLTLANINTLGFNKAKIEDKVFNKSNEVATMLNVRVKSMFKTNEFYASAFIKEELTKLYTTNKLSKKAKATDLSEYFELVETSRRIDGTKVKGFTLKSIN